MKSLSLKILFIIIPIFWVSLTYAAASNNDISAYDSLAVQTNDPVLPPPALPDTTGVYIDLGTGYAYINWADTKFGAFNNFSDSVTGSVRKNRKGGILYGADVGYQISPHIAAEAGWYGLPTVVGNSDIDPSLPQLTLNSWIGYLAAKVMVVLNKHFDFFMKAGLTYRYLRYSNTASVATGFGGQINHYWTALAAGGFQVWFDQNWSMMGQYLFIPNYTLKRNVSRQSPSGHLFILSVGYKFSLA